MGCCNDLATALDTTAAPDPTQHVNFAKGMVLGVDDFQQEFGYLSGRDQWLVRDAIGYGTMAGLRVFIEEQADGPRIHVTAGSAFVPSGQHVCVGADQCASLDKWLAKPANAAIVTQLLNPGMSPPGSPPFSPPLSPPLSPPDVTEGSISLYLTLCYKDCPTRPVPIPGEPCRSESDLMADSRIADDYRLELWKDPPAQVEEDALRDFVRWLHDNVDIVTSGPSPTADESAWMGSLRAAAQAWLNAAALSPPPASPPSVSTLGDYLVDLSPHISVGQGDFCAFLRVAFRFWVTELRPLWMARRCHMPMVKDQDCVLLARLTFDVEWQGGSPSGAWVVVGSPATALVDESKRPYIVHLRMLQEWALCGCDCSGMGVAAAMGGGGGGGMVPLMLRAPGVLPRIGGVPAPLPVLRTSSSIPLLDESNTFVVLSGAGPISVKLPASTSTTAGRMHILKNTSGATIPISADAGSTIDDKATFKLAAKAAVTVVADGAGVWQVVGTNG